MYKSQNKKGFSLIEGVIATFILSIGIIAIFSLLTKGLTQSLDNTKNITALGFAQEGVELVRVVRNNDYIKDSNNVFATLDSKTVSGTNSQCRVSPATASILGVFKLTVFMDCNNGDGTDANPYKLALSTTDTNSYYHHNVGSPVAQKPMFWRRIYISKPTLDSREVASVVFTHAPTASEWPANMAEVKTKCTVQNGCVFSQALLQ